MGIPLYPIFKVIISPTTKPSLKPIKLPTPKPSLKPIISQTPLHMPAVFQEYSPVGHSVPSTLGNLNLLETQLNGNKETQVNIFLVKALTNIRITTLQSLAKSKK